MAALKAENSEANLRRTEFVGPQVGDELAADGLKALAFVVIGIMLYLAVRFEWKFSVAAIIANLHDVIIILGFFAYLPMGVLIGRVGGGVLRYWVIQ
jgi:preprotein translocase subunit SecF